VKEDLELPLPWHLVGIQEFVAHTEQSVTIPLKDISGKAIIQNGLIIEQGVEWLQSRFTF